MCFTSHKENKVLNLRGSLFPLPVLLLFLQTHHSAHSHSPRNASFSFLQRNTLGYLSRATPDALYSNPSAKGVAIKAAGRFGKGNAYSSRINPRSALFWGLFKWPGQHSQSFAWFLLLKMRTGDQTKWCLSPWAPTTSASAGSGPYTSGSTVRGARFLAAPGGGSTEAGSFRTWSRKV